MIPSIVGDAIDLLNGTFAMTTLLKMCGLILLLEIVKDVFRFLMRYIIIGTSWKIENDIRLRLYEHLLRLPLSFYNRSRTGDIIARVTNDLNAVRMMVGPAVMYSINAAILGPATLIFMFSKNVELSLYAIIPFPVIALMIYFAGKRIHRYFRKVQESYSDISAHVQEDLNGIREIKAYVREEHEFATLRSLSEDYVAKNKRIINLQSFYHPFLDVLASGGIIIVLWIGGKKVAQGETTLGTLVSLIMYLGMLNWPSIALGWVVAIFQRGTASLIRINDILQESPERQTDDTDETPLNGEISVSGLSFSYDETSAVLDDVSFELKPGQTLAVVGQTGSGKTTLINLLSGVYNVPRGMIRYDGVDINDLPLNRLRTSIALVPQETFLFSETIAENIAFGRENADRDSIDEAARHAAIADEILSYPDGYDSILGERGLTVSGGQRQRIAIARALISHAPILFFDDCLSNVDTVTEMRILTSLKEVTRERTAVIVTHRLGAVADADLIMFIRGGKVIEKGTHEELMKLDGEYALLFNEQESIEKLESGI